LTEPQKYAKIIAIGTGGFNSVREGANAHFPRIKFFKNANDLNANDANNFNIENKTEAMSRAAGYQRATLNISPTLPPSLKLRRIKKLRREERKRYSYYD